MSETAIADGILKVQPVPELLDTNVQRRKVEYSKTLYQQLDKSRNEIRLLQIDPTPPGGDSSHQINCRLYKTTVIEAARFRFNILSYVWGSPEVKETILVNDQPVRVTSNLADFLRQWRQLIDLNDPVVYGLAAPAPSQIRVVSDLWVDAICINQDDTNERNSQVSSMAQLYSASHRSISWLGLETTSERLAIDSMAKMVRCIKEKKGDPSSSLDLILKEEPSYFERGDAKGTLNLVWSGIHKLFNSVYWERRWIFQETVLPTNPLVCCGGAMLHLDEILTFALWVGELREFKISNSTKIDPLLASILSHSTGPSLFGIHRLFKVSSSRRMLRIASKVEERCLMWHTTLFTTAFSYQATDPRDHLYGNLAITGADVGLQPDYSKSVEDVYSDYAMLYAKTTGRLSFLRAAGCGCATELKDSHRLFVATWVPNWDSMSKTSMNTGVKIPEAGAWYADGNPPVNFGRKARFQGRTLKAPGFRTGATKHIYGLVIEGEGEDPPKVLDRLFLQLCVHIMKENPNWPVQDSGRYNLPFTALFLDLAFMGGDIQYSGNPPTRPNENSMAKTLLRGMRDWAQTIPEVMQVFGELRLKANQSVDGYNEGVSGDDIRQEAAQSKRAVYIKTHCIFLTANGLMGWGPRAMRDGDAICIVFGCETPLVLRQIRDTWLNIGPCYVPGLMNGEAVAELAKKSKDELDDWLIERFSIV